MRSDDAHNTLTKLFERGHEPFEDLFVELLAFRICDIMIEDLEPMRNQSCHWILELQHCSCRGEMFGGVYSSRYCLVAR